MLKLTQGLFLKQMTSFRLIKSFGSAKDYYAVLGIKRGSGEDEIKDAYRNLAKKYHPDVNTLGNYHQPDGEKFKEIAEAYAVLSVPESRLNYDLLNQETPDSLYRAQREENYKKMMSKGPDGQVHKPGFPKGSYADERQQVLASERKRFNVDAFGRYKGGLPIKEGGFKRGSALGGIGILHEPTIHNMKINKEPDSQFVTSEDALAYKNYKNEDKYVIQRKWYWFKAEVDYEFFKFSNYRTGLVWFRNLFIILVGFGLTIQVYLRRGNRKILAKTKQIIANVGKKQNYDVDGKKVVLSANGILKLA